MVDAPEQVQVTETHIDRLTIIELNVAKGDVGKTIARQGRNARAIRTIPQADAAKTGNRATLETIDQ